MKNFKKLLTVAFAAMAFTLGGGFATDFVTGAGDAFAADGPSTASNGTGAAATCDLKADNGNKVIEVGTIKKCQGVDDINKRIYGLAKVIAGIVLGFAVLMIVYAGFKYTTSQGDPKVTEQAKMQIIAAGIGIGIAMLAFVIVNVFESLM